MNHNNSINKILFYNIITGKGELKKNKSYTLPNMTLTCIFTANRVSRTSYWAYVNLMAVKYMPIVSLNMDQISWICGNHPPAWGNESHFSHSHDQLPSYFQYSLPIFRSKHRTQWHGLNPLLCVHCSGWPWSIVDILPISQVQGVSWWNSVGHLPIETNSRVGMRTHLWQIRAQ